MIRSPTDPMNPLHPQPMLAIGAKVTRSTTTLLVGLLILLSGCGTTANPPATVSDASTTTFNTQIPSLSGSTSESVADTIATPAPVAPSGRSPAANASPPPDWLGSRVLPTTPDGSVVPQATPEELIKRQLITVDTLPVPSSNRFVGKIGQVPEDVAERSTWESDCPVPLDELRYLLLPFWGFDGLHHQGEMIVHTEVAEAVVDVFANLHDVRFPIEEMRVVTDADLAAEPTGDGNNTTSFVCRKVTNGSSFSQHAYGLAIDVNPFQNPYQRDDQILPELSTAYLDRGRLEPGMVTPAGAVLSAFEEVGWIWGGNWTTLKDYQHFSANGK